MQTIYKPKGPAREYSEWAANPYTGCGHGCRYCYVPEMPWAMSRETFNRGATPKPGWIDALAKEAAKLQAKGQTCQVMLSFTGDPYCPADATYHLTRDTITTLQAYGLSFVTLSKGGSRALTNLDLYRPGLDAYAATLTLLDPAASLRVEPGAALPDDRLRTLRTFHDAGVTTWASLEPVLDPDVSLELIRRSYAFVDLFKIGKLNYTSSKIDLYRFTSQAVSLLNDLGSRYLIKESLVPYLREGTPASDSGRDRLRRPVVLLKNVD